MLSILAIIDMQIKTIRSSNHSISIKVDTNFKKSDHTISWQGFRETRSFIHFLWEYKIVQLSWKTIWYFIIQHAINMKV